MSDQEGIRHTLAGYCQACDDGRFVELAALFTEDGTFAVGAADPVVGREAIATYIEAAMPPERRGRHLCGEPRIDLDADDRATATTDFVFVARSDTGGWSITATGRYTDHLTCDQVGTWRFRARHIDLL